MARGSGGVLVLAALGLVAYAASKRKSSPADAAYKPPVLPQGYTSPYYTYNPYNTSEDLVPGRPGTPPDYKPTPQPQPPRAPDPPYVPPTLPSDYTSPYYSYNPYNTSEDLIPGLPGTPTPDPPYVPPTLPSDYTSPYYGYDPYGTHDD